MTILTPTSDGAEQLDAPTPTELIAHAEELLAAAEGGIQLAGAKDVPALKAALAGAYAQVALAKIAAAAQQ